LKTELFKRVPGDMPSGVYEMQENCLAAVISGGSLQCSPDLQSEKRRLLPSQVPKNVTPAVGSQLFWWQFKYCDSVCGLDNPTI